MERCGPVAMYTRLLHEWPDVEPKDVAAKVLRFFWFYAINRHKMTVVTPSYHAESYSPDDNRFDLRPFLYPARFDAQRAAIERDVELRTVASRGPRPFTPKACTAFALAKNDEIILEDEIAAQWSMAVLEPRGHVVGGSDAARSEDE